MWNRGPRKDREKMIDRCQESESRDKLKSHN